MANDQANFGHKHPKLTNQTANGAKRRKFYTFLIEYMLKDEKFINVRKHGGNF